MANKVNLTLRIEPELRDQASELFQALGLDLSTATGLFYRQALRCHGLPFEVKLDGPVQPAGQLADAAESEPKEKDAAAKPKARKIAAGIAAALCLGCVMVSGVMHARDAAALQTATAALTAIRADYDKVQDVVYHGFVQLDTSQGLAADNGTVLTLVTDQQVDTVQDFQDLLSRVYTRDEAEDMMVYSFVKKGVLGEWNGALYRLDGGWTMGYPLDQPLLSARQTAPDTIVAETTIGHADPVQAVLTLKQEDGSWKIDDITKVV